MDSVNQLGTLKAMPSMTAAKIMPTQSSTTGTSGDNCCPSSSGQHHSHGDEGHPSEDAQEVAVQAQIVGRDAAVGAGAISVAMSAFLLRK